VFQRLLLRLRLKPQCCVDCGLRIAGKQISQRRPHLQPLGPRAQPARFDAPFGFKDIRLTLPAAESLRVPMPFGRLLHDRFLRPLAQGDDALDWAAIGGLSAQDARGP